jgi:hypothetical protein
MPTIQNRVVVPGLTTVDNVLSGSQYEFLPYDAELNFGLNGDANATDLRVDVYSGQDVLMENSEPTAQNRMPVFPDDYSLSDVAGAGERIKIRVRNSNAAPRTLFYALRITPA